MPIRHGGKAEKNAITLAAPQLLPHHHLFLGVDAVDLKHVLGDIQTDRGNLHLDGSPHVIRYNDHSMALRCRERAPSSDAGRSQAVRRTPAAGVRNPPREETAI